MDTLGDRESMRMAARADAVITMRATIERLKELIHPDTDYLVDVVTTIESQVDILDRDNNDILGDYGLL
jgi:tRNA A37 threonylcarbamoyladenosine dehydratase